MKILIITNSSGGLYSFRKELLSELKKKHDVIALTPNDGKEKELKKIGCKIVPVQMDRRGRNPFRDAGLLVNIFQKIICIKPDMVMSYTIKPNIYGGIVCRFLNIEYCINVTGLGTAFQKKGFLKKVVVVLYKFALKKVKVAFFENSSDRRRMISDGTIAISKTCLLKGAGVNLQHFYYQKYPLDSRVFSFLFIGRVMKEKGIEELFRVCHQIYQEGINIELHILGGCEEHFEKMIDRYSNEGWLLYEGVKDDIRPYIGNCHCVVLPSWHEGMANSNLEAAASGRPIITSNIPGCKEALIDGKSGLLCEPRNIKSLYSAMKKMIQTDRSEREKMGKSGRKHMEKMFDKRVVIRKTMEAMF